MYCAIDSNIKARGFQANNVYRFIERICQGAQSQNTVVPYGNKESGIKSMHSKARVCTDQMKTLNKERVQLQEKLKESHKHLYCTQKALKISQMGNVSNIELSFAISDLWIGVYT